MYVIIQASRLRKDKHGAGRKTHDIVYFSKAKQPEPVAKAKGKRPEAERKKAGR